MRQRGERIGRRFQVKKMMMRVDGFAEPCRLDSDKLNIRLYEANFRHFLVLLVKTIGERSFFLLIIIIVVVVSSSIINSFRMSMVSRLILSFIHLSALPPFHSLSVLLFVYRRKLVDRFDLNFNPSVC